MPRSKSFKVHPRRVVRSETPRGSLGRFFPLGSRSAWYSPESPNPSTPARRCRGRSRSRSTRGAWSDLKLQEDLSDAFFLSEAEVRGIAQKVQILQRLLADAAVEVVQGPPEARGQI